MLFEQIKEISKEIWTLRDESNELSQRIIDIEFNTMESDDYLVLNKSDRKTMIALNLKQPKQDFKVLNSQLKKKEEEKQLLKEEYHWLNYGIKLPIALQNMRF